MKYIQHFFERRAFGVCAWLGERMGISSASVRLSFIYVSFLTLGSPLLLYLILAFWVNVRKHTRRSYIWEF
ncbi:MAG: PspC domain-containing protein [Cytophagales bacterium]|nr:MAG: PspC domain-containing protein [Cytophagales bacterium]